MLLTSSAKTANTYSNTYETETERERERKNKDREIQRVCVYKRERECVSSGLFCFYYTSSNVEFSPLTQMCSLLGTEQLKSSSLVCLSICNVSSKRAIVKGLGVWGNNSLLLGVKIFISIYSSARALFFVPTHSRKFLRRSKRKQKSRERELNGATPDGNNSHF
jgi:hypothetical protein